ncbi:MAG: hypothetical protein N4A74_20810, partial [Carboxylicivirga sp.]|nr:hypothetical protein [Carboxylicivirga sp.]
VYISDKEKVYKIDFKNNELMFIVYPEVELKLIPVSKNRFILDRAIPEVTFTFICNKNGDVEKCRFVQVEKNIDKLLTRKN